MNTMQVGYQLHYVLRTWRPIRPMHNLTCITNVTGRGCIWQSSFSLPCFHFQSILNWTTNYAVAMVISTPFLYPFILHTPYYLFKQPPLWTPSPFMPLAVKNQKQKQKTSRALTVRILQSLFFITHYNRCRTVFKYDRFVLWKLGGFPIKHFFILKKNVIKMSCIRLRRRTLFLKKKTLKPTTFSLRKVCSTF